MRPFDNAARGTTSDLHEVIFIGLPGPYHNYSGLAPGNPAAMANKKTNSNPRAAALQALDLAQTLVDAKINVAIIPPQIRPEIDLMFSHLADRALKSGSRAALDTLEAIKDDEAAIIRYAAEHDGMLLKQMCSSASMWTANAGTITPASDSASGTTHITPANLLYNLHRASETEQTTRFLKEALGSIDGIVIHDPLPPHMRYSDEGAANHVRLAPAYGDKGLNVFVYGRDDADPIFSARPKKHPARQNKESWEELARIHGIPEDQVLLLQQNPAAIDAGVFHNDVISVGNKNVFMYHEDAFAYGAADIEALRKAYEALHPGKELILVPVSAEELSFEDAAKTYFFNSQIVSLPDGTMMIIAPEEAENNENARKKFAAIAASNSNPISAVKYLDLKQSMKNGGGPACLRLRMIMNEAQLTTLRARQTVMLDSDKIAALRELVKNSYRDLIQPRDLADPELHAQNFDTVSDILKALKLSVPDRDVPNVGAHDTPEPHLS